MVKNIRISIIVSGIVTSVSKRAILGVRIYEDHDRNVITTCAHALRGRRNRTRVSNV